MDDTLTREEQRAIMAPLSDRQRELLRYVALGAENKQIAKDLRISPDTVRRHINNIMARTDIHTRAGLSALYHGSRPYGYKPDRKDD